MELKELIEAVYLLLLEQKAVQASLLALSREKKNAIVKNDTDKLTEIVESEYKSLADMKKIEKRRMDVITKARGNTGKPAKDVTVSDLVKLTSGSQRDKLVLLQDELGEILRGLKAQNEENSALLKMQMEYTETMLAFIGATEDPLNNFYGTDGKSSPAEIGGGRTVFDAEI